jgi:hypothetical protein
LWLLSEWEPTYPSSYSLDKGFEVGDTVSPIIRRKEEMGAIVGPDNSKIINNPKVKIDDLLK